MGLFRVAAVVSWLVVVVVGPSAAADSASSLLEEIRERESRETPLVSGERWALLERCAHLGRTPSISADIFSCEYECRALARPFLDGPTDERARLWDFVDRLPPANSLRQEIVADILKSRVQEVLGTPHLPKARTPAALARLKLPGDLVAAPPRLGNAWRAYRTLADRYQSFLETAQARRSIEFQKHEDGFYAGVAAYLKHELSPVAATEHLAEYAWGGWCGTGAESLTRSQSEVLLLAALEQDDYDLAAAAAVTMGSRTMIGGDRIRGREQVLAAAGFDWEEVYVGALLDSDARFAGALGERGGETAAQMLLEVRRLAGGFPSLPFLDNALAAFVAPGEACRRDGTTLGVSSDDVTRDADAPRISKGLEQEVLMSLASVGPSAERIAAQDQVDRWARLCRAELRPALRGVLQSPFVTIRERAWEALTSMGESVPRPERRPVRFRLQADGVPVADTKVLIEVFWTEGDLAEATAITDARGGLALTVDWFIDPGHPVEGVRFSSADFSGSVAAPEELERPTIVEMEAVTLDAWYGGQETPAAGGPLGFVR